MVNCSKLCTHFYLRIPLTFLNVECMCVCTNKIIVLQLFVNGLITVSTRSAPRNVQSHMAKMDMYTSSGKHVRLMNFFIFTAGKKNVYITWACFRYDASSCFLVFPLVTTSLGLEIRFNQCQYLWGCLNKGHHYLINGKRQDYGLLSHTCAVTDTQTCALTT